MAKILLSSLLISIAVLSFVHTNNETIYIGGKLEDLKDDFYCGYDCISYLTFFPNHSSAVTSKYAEINPLNRNESVEKLEIGSSPYRNQFLPIKIAGIFLNLKIYHVKFQSITEIRWENFENFIKLEELKILDNNIELNIQQNSFGDLLELKGLSLERCKITKLPARLLKNNQKLETVCLVNNFLTSLSLKFFEGLSQLKRLDLSYNQFNSLNEDIFINLHKLDEINLRNNKFQSLPEKIFANLHKLKVCDLSYNKFSSLSEKIFHNLLELREIWLHNNRLTTLHFKLLIKNPKLESIDLKDNKLSLLDSRIFVNNPNLMYINLE